MKAVIENTTGKVLYFFSDGEDVVITETRMTKPIIALDIKSATHSVVTTPTPDIIQGGIYSWVNDALVVTNQDAYDAKLDELKATKKTELATSRYNEEIGGFESGGNTYYSDERSQLKMLQTLSAMSSGAITTVDWKTMDGTWVTHDATSLGIVYSAGLAFVQGLFAKEKTLGDQADAATTKAELDAIRW